jgi:succinate-acetate transporter protein
MKFDFFQFCFTVIMFAAIVLLVGGSFVSNNDAASVGGYLGIVLFLVSATRFFILEGLR